MVAIDDLKPLGNETRKHSYEQVRKLAKSIDEFGFVLPILVDAENRVVAGWGVVQAARKLQLSGVPAIKLANLSEAQLRALRLALNRLGEESSWIPNALRLEFTEILKLDANLDLDISGFDMGEIDMTLSSIAAESDEKPVPAPATTGETQSQPGDLWGLGQHRVLCGDALLMESYRILLGEEKAQLVFTDPPYNVPINGHVSGLGGFKHEEFAMASGEMSSPEFAGFLKTALGHAANHSVDGAIHFICMDWRHLKEVTAAGDQVYSELKNICVWNKTNGGMGSLYRSKHEFVLVYKYGSAPHINNVSLGRHGRNRSNVWDYAGANIAGPLRRSMLDVHPTVKPVALVADAILDCSRRDGLVLDPFAGSGSTLIAADKTDRRAALIEYEPHYVDVILQRWREHKGSEPELLSRKAAA
jgi:DNA modification methylase